MNVEEIYKLLELDLNEDATQETLKKAYKRAVLKHHPDKGGDVKTFLKVKEAYEYLKEYLKQRDEPTQQEVFIYAPSYPDYGSNYTATSSNSFYTGTWS